MKNRIKPRTEDELIAELRSDLADCTPYDGSTVAIDRAESMKYYLQEPFGNEIDGRSQVITSDVSDTVEWMLPQLIKIFTSSDEAVIFDPVGPEDIDAARQETDYLNHVFYKDNDGFMVLYSWFKDALLQKNGVIKYFWEDQDEKTQEMYVGLTLEETDLLLMSPDIEVMEQEILYDENENPTFDLKIQRSNKKGRVRILNIPPEDFKIDSSYADLDLKDCRFCAHISTKSRSDLIAMGYERSVIEDLEPLHESKDSPEYSARFDDISGDDTDDSEDMVVVTECYKRMDWNDDGYDELRKITLANEHTILENVEIDYIPFVAITPIVMTHRFFGRSIADITMDLQAIRSTLLRNILDNLYLINNVRMGVVEGEVNLDDALDSRPGGVVRMTAPQMLFPIQTTPFTGHSYQMMEYLDAMRENRTGVTRYNQGMSADVLNKTATGISKIMAASHERMMLVARLFAEGVKRLFLGMHRLVLQNQDKERIIRIRNTWVPINPNEWRDRENMTINVALGTNDKQQEAQNLMLIANVQKEMIAGGLSNMVTPENLFNTAIKLVEATGLKHYELFFTDPKNNPPPPPKPDPNEEFLKVQAQVEMMKTQIEKEKVELDKMKVQLQHQIDMTKLQIEQGKLQLEAEKAALGGVIDENRLNLSEYQTDVKASMDKYTAELKVKSDIIKEKVKSDAAKSRTDI